MRLPSVAALLCACALLWSAPASADPIGFEVVLHVLPNDGQQDTLGLVGAFLTMNFTIDPLPLRSGDERRATDATLSIRGASTGVDGQYDLNYFNNFMLFDAPSYDAVNLLEFGVIPFPGGMFGFQWLDIHRTWLEFAPTMITRDANGLLAPFTFEPEDVLSSWGYIETYCSGSNAACIPGPQRFSTEIVSASARAIPEPGSLAFIGLGLGGGFAIRRSKRTR